MNRGARKYGNKIVDFNGTKFHSRRELQRWLELTLMEKAGVIRDLERQVPITLQGAQGPICFDGGRKARLVVDFSYKRADDVTGASERVWEDAKGFENHVSKLKRAIVRSMGIEVRLV